MSRRKDSEEPNLVLFTDNDLPLGEIAFDEMNIVELPFALLTRNTDGIYEIPLASDGKSTLACLRSSKHGLPNSLAPRVLLGLMWLWSRECAPQTQTFRLRVRELVQRYMYPSRFRKYAPGGELLRAVERQINCIANSRIHTDRWWDQTLKRKKEANDAIISDVSVLEKGGRNRSRILEITWGKEFWESLKHRYTKPIDARIVQSLDSPLDLQLYRLLDRQLAAKPSQHYANIISFAKFKLGMQGKTLEAGGRTASSYVAQKLTASLKRLSRQQFTVRMTIDRSADVFSVSFERIDAAQPDRPHEVKDEDLPGELIREFLFHAHKVPRDKTRRRVAKQDRLKAKEWVEAYGLDKAKWMVARAVRLQKERGSEPILLFRGLELYESAAEGAFEQHQAEKAGQLRLAFEQKLDGLWKIYLRWLVQKFDAQASPEQLAELEQEALGQARSSSPAGRSVPLTLLQHLARASLSELKRKRMNGLPEQEFRAHRSVHDLRDALVARHGSDPIADPAAA